MNTSTKLPKLRLSEETKTCDDIVRIFNDRIVYYNHHQSKHRDNDLPAIKWANGDNAWYQHGQPHRDNGKPGIIYANGSKVWCLKGQVYNSGKDKL